MSVSPIQILLVEDNPGDVRLTEEALKDAKVHTILHVAKDGVEALTFLRKTGQYADAPMPDIILLDLNLPRMNGLEVLKEIKNDEKLRQIPVVVITSSKAEEDVAKSYHLHANCYITKPIDFSQFIVMVQSIENFWFTIVRLPTRK
ncbi:MAG TPA: response regulator [Verrucomicrobiae bacterium]|jgi:two-component system response regulator|nr:response regulator [Verrucomicrobiae bacterium]